MMRATNEASPIGFAPSAFAADGEVDEANLFAADDALVQIDEAAIVAREAQRELEELLDAPVAAPNDEGDAVADEQEAGEVDVLDALLEESMAPVKAKAEMKAHRDLLNRGGLSKAERAAIEQKVREWEARVEWEPQANVALFMQQWCRCGNVCSIFGGLMQRQAHRTNKTAKRWVAVENEMLKLPNEVIVQKDSVRMCVLCCDDRGYQWAKATDISAAEGV